MSDVNMLKIVSEKHNGNGICFNRIKNKKTWNTRR